MTTVLAYVPATRQTVPVMIPERILKGRRPESPRPLEQPTPSHYHRLLKFLADSRQHIKAWRNLRSNQANCALYRLPDELHIEIAQYLSAPDLLHLAHSSRRSTFLTHKFATTPRFRVCEHKSYSPEGLERALWTRPPMLLRAPLCPSHQHTAAGFLGPELGMLWERGAFVAVLTTAHALGQLPRDPARGADTLQTALKQLAEHICPHVNSADEAVWDELKTCLGRQNGEVVAQCRQCGAAYGMLRETLGTGVVLTVQRRVRGLEKPDCQEVLVQLEDCSPRVQVNDDAKGEERDLLRRIRGWVEWVLGLVVGFVILAVIWRGSRSLPVQRRVDSQPRGDLQGDSSGETIPLLGEAVD